VIDTGIWPSTNAYHAPVWLDNSQFLILTTQDHKASTKPESYVIYNVKTRKISNTPLINVGIWCTRDGQFVFSVKTPKNDTVYRGNLNHSKRHPKPDGDWMMDQSFDCDWVPTETSTAGKINYVYPYFLKLRGKNYLEIFENGKRLYHEHLGDVGMPYPPGDTTYSEYLDAYIISHHDYDTDKLENKYYWVTKRNGQITEIPYPRNMFVSDRKPGDHQIFPIKPGYLIHYYGAGFDYKTNGLYLINEGKLKHVLSGFVKELAVSPNGCVATFGYAKNVKEDLATVKNGFVVDMPKTTVKLINFCEEQ
jgi:hypothetical protein